MTRLVRRHRGAVGALVLGVLVGLATRCAPVEPALPRCPAPPVEAHERCAP